MTLAARNMWKDIKAYDLGVPSRIENLDGLKVKIPSL
jgi:hypothetical protein